MEDGWMVGWLDGWLDGWMKMYIYMYVCIYRHICIYIRSIDVNVYNYIASTETISTIWIYR
jgi:hypothetical protein